MAVQREDEAMTFEEKLARLKEMRHYTGVPESELKCLAEFPVEEFPVGTKLLTQGQVASRYLVALEGFARVYSQAPDRSELTQVRSRDSSVIGEIGLLSGLPAPVNVEVVEPILAIVVEREEYFALIARCKGIREADMHSMAKRVILRQELNLREEKMASLGTLTAGLMHELNNPGAAAGRAAAQLRENLNRMHAIAKGFSEKEHTPEQGRCIWEMQEKVLGRKRVEYMNSLAQSDAEEHLAEWMEQNHVKEAWRIAPTFAASGITEDELECIREQFQDESISMPLSWVEAMVGSMQMVDTIEESVNRVSTLVGAVKTYTHEGQGQIETVDMNRSVFATIVILKHKMREFDTRLVKEFGENLPLVQTRGSSLNQVWTNLIDNAIQAAGQNGEIRIKTWHEDGEVFVNISDNGPGIPKEQQGKIFDPFFTTKPAGVGTGLGLAISHQIVKEYGGDISFTTGPEGTSFTVQLPSNPAKAAEQSICV